MIALLIAGAPLSTASPATAEHGGGDVDAGCSPDGMVTVQRGEPFAIAIDYVNGSGSDVTFTATMNSNQFFEAGVYHTVTLPSDPGVATRFRFLTSTSEKPEGTDHVRIEVTSDATGSTVLGVCDFVLTVNPGPLRSLTVGVIGQGGSVILTSYSAPGGINCVHPGCVVNLPEDEEVTLTAEPAEGWVFGGWSSDCTGMGACMVVMATDKEVTATFVPRPTIEVTLNSSGSIRPREGITISGTYTCTDADDVVISGEVQQQRARTSNFVGGSFQVFPDGPCDGNPHTWEARNITSETNRGRFFLRDTNVTARGEACNSNFPSDPLACAEDTTQRPMSLSRR